VARTLKKSLEEEVNRLDVGPIHNHANALVPSVLVNIIDINPPDDLSPFDP
jgi:hypothetical protein